MFSISKMLRPFKLGTHKHLAYLIVVCFLLGTNLYVISNNKGKFRLPDDPVIIHLDPVKDDVTCHSSSQDDGLPAAEEPSFSPGPKSIFFHETSCRGGIDSRQACTIESAARAHPDREVYLLFNSPVSEKMLRVSCIAKLLRTFPNVKVARIYTAEYSKNTLVHSVMTTKLLKSTHPIEHTSDILRCVTLYKYGGIYLDLDQLVLKSFDSLPQNWIAKEDNDTISTGVMAFSKEGIGHNITTAILKEISETFTPEGWTDNGPEAIFKVLDSICPSVIENYGNCNGLQIYPGKNFYPLHYIWKNGYFKAGDMDIINHTNNTYTHHFWNKLTHDMKIEKDSPYAKMAQQFCPTIYEMYGDRFGD